MFELVEAEGGEGEGRHVDEVEAEVQQVLGTLLHCMPLPGQIHGVKRSASESPFYGFILLQNLRESRYNNFLSVRRPTLNEKPTGRRMTEQSETASR